MMSRFVFQLPPEYRNILRYLAERGPSNINEISKFTESFGEHSLQRWGVHKRIYGSSGKRGLIPHQYLVVEEENKRRYGKREKSYHLTAKGIIASLATTRLNKNYFFRSRLDFIHNFPLVNLTPNFITKYIDQQIDAFLAYHYVHGMQLTWMRDFHTYYSDFIERFHKEKLRDHIDSVVAEEFHPLIKEYQSKYLSYKFSYGSLEPIYEGLSILYWAPEIYKPIKRK